MEIFWTQQQDLSVFYTQNYLLYRIVEACCNTPLLTHFYHDEYFLEKNTQGENC